MTDEFAIAFLQDHQPMPDDEHVSQDLIDTYDQVRQHFLHTKKTDCIPLLLNSFGRGSGFGVYQLIEDVIGQFPPDLVIPHIIAALQNNRGGIRYWVAQIAAGFPSELLIPHLSQLLRDSDRDVRSAAATSLEGIDDPQVKEIFSSALENEKDPEIYMQLKEALA